MAPTFGADLGRDIVKLNDTHLVLTTPKLFSKAVLPILRGAPNLMSAGPTVILKAGRGGHGTRAGTGGQGGNIHVHDYGVDNMLLMSLRTDQYAAHDSIREGAPSSCLQGTREAVLNEIRSWSESTNERSPVFLVTGLAGIGKSTIAKTVAEQAQDSTMLGATFFFSKRSCNSELVFPTLAFQLAQSDNAFRNVIVEALAQYSRIWRRKTLSSQLQALILTPLLRVGPRQRNTLLILDALDECEKAGAAEILRLLFSDEIRIPPFLRILITSRPRPHLSSVFNKVPSSAMMILHDIEASVVRRDISLYISTELSEIPRKLGLVDMPPDWATEIQMNLLVEKCGELFVYAATVLRFIGDDHVRDPRKHLTLLLDTQSPLDPETKPYLHLDALYREILLNSLSPYNLPENRKRFQVVIGSIVLLREPLPLDSLARFVQCGQQTVETTLDHLRSVIVPQSGADKAPRIYHPSFREFIMDDSRCSIPGFVIAPLPDQELRHAIRCFELISEHLKRDIAGILDPSRLNEEVDQFERKVTEAILPEVRYACKCWALHLSHVKHGEKTMVEALELFSVRSILCWFETMSLIGEVSTAESSIQEAHRWARDSSCKSILVAILSDACEFIATHREVIKASALHVYESALPFTPYRTPLYRIYCEEGKGSIRVLQGRDSKWPSKWNPLIGRSGSVTIVGFSSDGFQLASGSDDGTLQLWDAVSGAHTGKLEGHSDWIRAIAFSHDGFRLASGSNDGTLRVWDTRSGARIASMVGHSDWIKTIAFSPDGMYLASASESDDMTLRLWNVKSGSLIEKLEGHSTVLLEVSFSTDGCTLIARTSVETLTWDLKSRPRRLVPASSASPLEPIVGLPHVWSLHGQWIQVKCHEDGLVRRICYIPPHYPVTRISVSGHRTHSRIAIGCRDGRVIILAVAWDPFDWQLKEGQVDMGLAYVSTIGAQVSPGVLCEDRGWSRARGLRGVWRRLKVLFCC